MKAIIVPEYGDANVLQTAEISPPQPGRTELLVNVHAVGVNRADILQRRGQSPPPPGDSEIMGLEIAGVVEALGEETIGFQKGDRIFGLVAGGGYAEQALMDYRLALPIPELWDFAMAAGVSEVFFTAHETLFTLGELTAHETVLIHAGSSGVGSAGTQMAHLMGAKVFTTLGSQKKIGLSLKLGSSVGINYKTQDFVEEIQNVTAGQGVNLIQDFIGASYLNRNLKILRHQGRLALIGLLGGSQAEINLATIMSKRLHLFGWRLRNLPLVEKIAIKERFEKNWFSRLIAGQVRPVIDQVFPLEQAAEAHKYMEANQHFGKIILAVQ